MTETRQEQERIVCVYCASSRACHAAYHEAAFRLGGLLAEEGYTIVYGGGGVGSMGALADGALEKGGRVIGIMPEFMVKLEWGHPGITDLRLVEDLRLRKHLMLSESDAVVALPGGSGTFEELLEAITLKRLGLYVKPIILVNTRGFYNPLLELLSHAIAEKFMGEIHGSMWQVVNEPEDVVQAIASAPLWSADAQGFATQ